MTLRRQPERCETVEVTLDGALVTQAVALGLDPPRILENALRSHVVAEQGRRWLEENAEAIRLSNEELAKNGLWCADHRLF